MFLYVSRWHSLANSLGSDAGYLRNIRVQSDGYTGAQLEVALVPLL
jgi:hypothetical protein